ncbi:MAG: DUF2723 domain-containing protein [Myxococcales bacterium]|nr:DUF2723 domain-containing protein [Myxococcales bacterium]
MPPAKSGGTGSTVGLRCQSKRLGETARRARWPAAAPRGTPSPVTHRWSIPLLLALSAAAFIWSAAPALTTLDAGELGAAAFEQGIAHPPGFPIFTLVNGGLMRALPFGDLAFRGAVASGLVAAVCVALLARLAERSGRTAPSAGILTLLALTCAGPFALHARTIEVYTGLGLFVAVLLSLRGLAASAPGDGRPWLALFFLSGLGLGHHPLCRLLSVLILAGAFLNFRRSPLTWNVFIRRGGAALAFVALGASTLLYLPLRAITSPERNWGDPSTLAAFMDHFSGARIRAAFAERMFSFDPQAFSDLLDTLTPGAFPLLALGLVGLSGLFGTQDATARAARGWARWVLLIDGLYAVFINPMGNADGQNLLPTMVVMGFGALEILAVFEARSPKVLAGLAGLALSIVFLVPGVREGLLHPQSAGRALPQALARLTDKMPPRGVVFVSSDHLASGAAFLQVVEGGRPDMAVVVRQHVWDESSMRPIGRRRPEVLEGWSAGQGLGSLKILDGSEYAIGWEWARGVDESEAPEGLNTDWPVLNRNAGQSAVSPPFAESLTSLDEAFERASTSGGGDEALAGLYGGFALDLGLFELRQGRRATASDAFVDAVRFDPDSSSPWSNLGVIASLEGRFAEALALTRTAAQLEPHHRVPLVNVTRYALTLGLRDEAQHAVDELLERDDRDADALGLRGVLRAQAAEMHSAAEDFSAALKIDPNQPEARAGWDKLRGYPSRTTPP